jgi:hypothetical protein
MLSNKPVQMDVNQAHAGIRSPMSKQANFQMLGGERLAEQGSVAQVNHPETQIQAGSEVCVDILQFIRRERTCSDCAPRWPEGAEGTLIRHMLESSSNRELRVDPMLQVQLAPLVFCWGQNNRCGTKVPRL